MDMQQESLWRILHIDDDEDDYLLIGAMAAEMREPKVQIEWASTYAEGRAKLADNHYDAVLVDYDLGPETGLEIIREFSPRYPAPLILYTGRGSREVDQEALQAGATFYLTKNEVTPLLLERAVRYAIQLKQREVDLRQASQRLEEELAERQRAQAAYQASEHKFSLFFSKSALPSAVSRLPQGEFVEVNDAWETAFGYTRQEALGKTSLALGIHPDAETRAQITAQLLEQGSARGLEARLRTKTGEWRDFLLNLDVVEIDRQKYVINSTQDITARKEAERALLKSEARWREFLDSTHDNYIALDHEWRFTYANRHYSELMGLEPDALIGRNYWELFPQYLGTDLEQNYRRVMQGNEPFHYRQGGIYTQRMYDVSLYPTSEGLAIFSIDRTDELHYQQQLEDERARMQDVLQAMPVAVWIADPTGKVVYKNNLADRIWGGNAPLSENVEGYAAYVAWYLDSGKPLAAEDYPVAQSLRTGQPGQPVELRIQRFDGTFGIVLATGAPIKDREGRLAGAVAINVDLSEYKQAGEAVRMSEERLRSVLESTHDLVFLLDRDWRFQYVNQRFADTYRSFAEDFTGKQLFEVFDRYLNTPLVNHYRIAMEQRIPVHFNLESAYTDASYEISGYPTREGIAVFSKDRTEEKRAREALRESENRFRDLANHISQLVWTADQTGNIVWFNQRCFDYTGATLEESKGEGWHRVVHPEDLGPLLVKVDQAMRTGLAWEETFRIRGRDDNYRWFLSRVIPIYNEEGQVLRWFGTATDINDQWVLQKQLEEQRASLETILQALPVGVWVTDAEGRILIKNSESDRIWAGEAPMVESMDGYHEYRSWEAATGQELKTEDYPLAVVLRTGQPVEPVEHIIQRFDGTRGIVLVSATPVKDATGRLTGAVAVNVDLTEQNQSRQALAVSEQRYRELVETLEVERNKLTAVINEIPVGVCVGDTHGNVLSLNRAGLSLHGFSSEAEMFNHLENYTQEYRLLLPDGAPLPEDQWPAARALRGDFVQQYEVILANLKDGSRRVVVYSANPVHNSTGETILIIYTMQDLTERKRAEQALREGEANFRQLADAMPQLVWTALPDGTVDYYNQRHELYRGIGRAELGQWEWGPVLHPEDLQVTLDAWNRAVQTGEIYQVEHRVQMADGSYRWHLSRGIPAWDEQGRICRWYGTATDIHDQKTAEQELRISYEELERANQALQEFTSIASHDLQEPLHKIQSFGQLLVSRYTNELGEEGRNYLVRISSATARMGTMIQDLLAYSRVTSRGAEYTRVDLQAIVNEVLSDLEIRIEETGGQVRVGALPVLQADALQMRQLFQNLIGNALKYHRPEVPPVVDVSAESENGAWLIRVRDNGIGIDPRFAERIFEPFTRAHGRSAYEGTGMGLAICKKIVERHGGSIAVESQPGHGCTFVIRLPRRRLAE